MADATIAVIIEAYTKGLEDGMRRSQESTAAASKSMTRSLAEIGLAAQTVQRLFKDTVGAIQSIYAAGKEGAALLDLERRFTMISGGAEQAAANLEVMRTATKGTVADAELMNRGLAMISSGLARNQEDLETIMKTVPALGQIFKGFAADRSMLSYTMMISNGLQSVRMRADDFGLSIIEVERRMKELQAAGLAERDALQQAVNEQLLRNYERLGLNVKTAADEMREAEAQATNLGNTFKKALAPLSLEVAEGLSAIVNALGTTSEEIPVLVDVFFSLLAFMDAMLPVAEKLALAFIALSHAMAAVQRGDFAQAQRDLDAMVEAIEAVPGTLEENVRASLDRFRQMWHATDVDIVASAEQAADDVTSAWTEALDEIGKAQEERANKLGDIMQQLARRIEDETLRLERQREDRDIAATRRAQDRAIDAARRRADMEREIGEQLARARIDAEKSRHAAAQALADRMLEIEEDFQQRKRDIEREFAQSEAEAIASRDALALVRARRKRDDDLRAAQEARDKQRGEAQRDYNRQLEEIKAALAEQEQAARDARARMEEDLRRSQERQLEDEIIRRNRELVDEQIHQARMEQDRALWLRREGAQMQQAFNAKMAQIRAQYAAEEQEARNHQARMQQISAGGTGGTGGSRRPGARYMAAGGAGLVTQPTHFVAGEREPEYYAFVPQSRARDGGRGLFGSVTVQQNFQFSGGFSVAEKQWFRQVAYEQAHAAIGETIGGS